MRGEFYLVLRKKDRPAGTIGARVVDRSPRLDAGEIAVKVKIDLPDMLFMKPVLEARISVPADRLLPVKIDADVAENITQTLKQNLGMDLNISIEEAA
jgi:hypothetical protein